MNSTNYEVGGSFSVIKGNDIGTIVKWNGDIWKNTEDGNTYMIFSDGSQLMEHEVSTHFQYLGKIAETNSAAPNQQAQNTVIAKPGQEGVEIMKPPPGYKSKTQQAPTQKVVQETPAKKEETVSSPIEKLLQDSLKKSLNLQVSIKVDIPPVELLKVLSDSYDDGYQQVLNFLAKSLIDANIGEQIAKEIWSQAIESKKPVQSTVRKTPVKKPTPKQTPTKKITIDE
jgi:hypothetical protein